MAKRRIQNVPLRFPGKTFLLDGDLSRRDQTYFGERIRREGGTVATGITPNLSCLLLNSSRKKRGRSSIEQEVAKANTAGASIEAIDTDDFFELVKYSQEEALSLLRGGPAEMRRFLFAQPAWAPLEIVLEDCDLQGIDLERIRLSRTKFVNVDFRNANLKHSELYAIQGGQWAGAQLRGMLVHHVTDCNFDGLSMPNTRLKNVTNSSFRQADLSGESTNTTKSHTCDYSEANLSRSCLPMWQASQVVAVKANWSQATIERARLAKIDLTEADLNHASLLLSDLSQAKLKGANLTRTNLHQVNLQKADLRGANLTYANLTEADLTGAKIKGANFTGANLRDAKLDGLNPKSAKGLSDALQPFVPGPNLQELDNLAAQGLWLELRVAIETDAERTQLSAIVHDRKRWIETREASPSIDGKLSRRGQCYPSVGEALHELAKAHTSGEIVPSTVFIKIDSRQSKQHQALALRAWYEALGRPIPTKEEMQNAITKEAEQGDTRQRDLAARLRKGQAEIEAWNAMKQIERDAIPLAKIDLSQAKLPKIRLSSSDLREADFRRADLEEAALYSSKLRKANFQNARLVMCKLHWSDCTKADFSGANLREANLRKTNLREANLHNADLSDCNLREASLRAADLTGANLTGAKLYRTKYDSKTKFPVGFTPHPQMKWMESSAAPSVKPKKKVAEPVASIPFSEFMEKLPKVCRGGKIDNAVRMLKAERFQLYAQVEDDHIVSVVRSQSSSSRVYACRLDADGTYSCGTQNLRACGGLQGSPCKHLLVLLIGLAKADKLDSGKAYQWIESASKERPTLDKDDASETFLRYKGAEAGEVDWRPTETIPEDFYAL